MSKEFENNDPALKGRRRFIGAGAGLLGLAWATQASAGWIFICDRPKLCFLEGTRIETETGLVPVELLKAGDRVRTLDGTFKPIRWIGSPTVAKPHAGDWSRNDAPILIHKDAFGDGAPRSDLPFAPPCVLLRGRPREGQGSREWPDHYSRQPDLKPASSTTIAWNSKRMT